MHEAIPRSGYVIFADIPVNTGRKKHRMAAGNLRIYRQMRAAGDPMDGRSLYYYGRELLTHGEYEEGIGILRDFLNRSDGWVGK